MIAYHGTSSERVGSIRREGLRAPSFLSLSREGALFYAKVAAALSWARGDAAPGAIVTVEVEQHELEPDASLIFRGAQKVARAGVPPQRVRGVEVLAENHDIGKPPRKTMT